jgi:hypothetical protein
VRRRTTLIVAALAASLALAACGSSAGLIPADNATTLTAELSTLGTALVNHDCDEARAALQQINIDIETLPSSVDKKLRANLTEGYGVLAVHAPRQCHEKTIKPSGPTGPSGATTATGPTGPTGTSSPSGATTTTSPNGTTTPTSPSGTSIGPGGGSQAPTGSTGTTTGTTGSTTDNVGGGVGAQ